MNEKTFDSKEHNEKAVVTGNTAERSRERRHHSNLFLNLYGKHYKQLMIFSILLVVLSLGTVAHKYITTGDFVDKGITLKGGITLTATTTAAVDPDAIQNYLWSAFPKSDLNVRSLSDAQRHGFIVEMSGTTQDQLLTALQSQVTMEDYSIEVVGPSLGSSFFNQTLKALFVAFIFMSLVIYMYFGESKKFKWIAFLVSLVAAFMMFYAKSTIFYIIPILLWIGLIILYFKDSIPSFGIMLCAFSDVFFSLAVFNLMGLKLNTGGVAAFLMLVGYSIDTDILLSVRVLKRKEGSLFDRILGAMKTGMMMSISALIAVLTAYFLTHSLVIKEIMFILAVGLVGDIIFTWIQNAGILRWHLEKKGWQ